MRWRYAYPQAEFPYADLVSENARRGRTVGEYELLDTGAFADGRYWDIDRRLREGGARRSLPPHDDPQRGPRATPSIDVLPTLWFRNRWSWDPGATKPKIGEDGRRAGGRSRRPGPDRARGRRQPRAAVLRQREQHASPVGRRRAAVSEGRDQRPRRRRRGDRQSRPAPAPRRRCATSSRWTAGESAEIRLRLAPERARRRRLVVGRAARPRAHEADDFYASLAPGRDPRRARW